MFMDNKGKLFGKVSIIDVLIIIAVIVCVLGIYVRFISLPQRAQVEPCSFTYQVFVQNIRENSVMALKQSIGTQFKLGEKGRSDDLGTLKDVSFTPMKEVIIQSSGAPVPADSPTKFNVVLTFEIDGLSNDMGYYTPQLKDIGVGGTLIVKNKFIKTEGRVISLKEF